MKDFEGWQGRSDYEGYITNTLRTRRVMTKVLPTLQSHQMGQQPPLSK